MTKHDKIYKKIENLSNREFKNFTFEYLGAQYIFDIIDESLKSDEDNLDYAFELLK